MNYDIDGAGNLRIRIDQDDDSRDSWEAIEYMLANGWDRILPEEIGALTDAPILSDDSERGDQGELVALGRAYWYPDYQITDPLDEMRTPEGAIFTVVEMDYHR